jgi:hypothetical protein
MRAVADRVRAPYRLVIRVSGQHMTVAVLCFDFPGESRAAQLHDRVHGSTT